MRKSEWMDADFPRDGEVLNVVYCLNYELEDSDYRDTTKWVRYWERPDDLFHSLDRRRIYERMLDGVPAGFRIASAQNVLHDMVFPDFDAALMAARLLLG